MRLLATELVTNSVQHAGLAPEDELELRVELFADHIRVDVIDEGRWRRESALSTDARPHHGLLLLGALADRWGVAKNATTRVWFEIDF